MSEQGYRYWEAMRLIVGARFPGGLSSWDDGSETGPLIDRLVNGDWHATGRRVRGQGLDPSERHVIPPNSWDFLAINSENDTAAGGGAEYVGVRFHRGTSKPAAKLTAGAESDCRKWLIETMKLPRTTTVEDLKAQAMNEMFPGLSGKAFGRAVKEAKRQPTTDPGWQQRGPVRVSTPV